MVKRERNPDEELAEQIFLQTHYRDMDGRYVVRIPFKPESHELGYYRGVALTRYRQMESKLAADPNLSC